MEHSYIDTGLTISALLINVLGALALSVPTVGGADLLASGIGKIRPIIRRIEEIAGGIIFIIFLLLFILDFISDFVIQPLHLFGAISQASTISFMKIVIYGIIVLLPFGVIHLGMYWGQKLVIWIEAVETTKAEKERRIGWIGIMFLIIGFIIQAIQTLGVKFTT